MTQQNKNVGDLSRSSSASKAMRNMGMSPGVQAKLLAFQAKRQQQMQQSKKQSSADSISQSTSSPSLVASQSTGSNSNIPITNLSNINTKFLSNDSNDVIADIDDESTTVSPLNSKKNSSINNSNYKSPATPVTPLSMNSSTFNSPTLPPNDDPENLSRRTSFRINSQATSGDESVIRRTSFRISKHNSITSNGTVSDDSEENLRTIANINNTYNNDSNDTNYNKNSSILTSLYPVDKNLSYLSKIQKIQSQSQSNSSSSESLNNSTASFHPTAQQPPSLPPLPCLPSFPSQLNISDSTLNASTKINTSPSNTDTKVNKNNTNNTNYAINNANPNAKNNNNNNINNNINNNMNNNNTIFQSNLNIPSKVTNIKTRSTSSTSSKNLSLSQRRGMKLNFDSLNNTQAFETPPSSSSPSSVSLSSNVSTPTQNDNHLKSFNDINIMKNRMNTLTLNSTLKNNRSSMNKLRDNSLPTRRNAMNLNLNSLNNSGLNTPPKLMKSRDGGISSNGFTPFAKYIDIKSGSLNFSGKASLHSKGIDFSNGSSFRISMDDLEVLEELGHGNYGVVSKVLHKPTNIIMAMKEVRLELDDSKFSQILMELEVLHSCNSDCIVEFYGAFFVEGAVYMCMEFMEGGSLDKIYGNGIPEDSLAYITKRVVLGLKKLKDEQNIIHRDVKPTNMLVNEDGKVKLCDFGVSGNLVASLARTNIGCQSYMAPERIKHTNPDVSTYSVQSDVWSLGLSILEIAKGCYPYPPETYNNVFSQLSAIVDGEPPTLPVDKFSPEAQDFVRQCLHKNPNKRPNYGKLLVHPWLSMYSDIQGQETLKSIVSLAIKKRESGKDDKSEKSLPALHNGLQI